MADALPVLGVVLAGGRGLRMGGADKGLLDWHGRPLAAWVLTALRPQVQAVAISCNRHAARYAALGAPVVADADPSAFAGPLAGLVAALDLAGRQGLDWVWTVPCDAPVLPADLGAALWAARGEAAAVLPRTPEGRLQPAHALVHRRVATALAGRLAKHRADRPSLAGCLLELGARVMDWPGALPNLNTPADLALSAARPPP